MGSLILVMTVVTVLPALATEDLNDSGLDRVSASGQTAVISTSGANSPIIFTPVTEIALLIAGSAQNGLRALVLNNVVGENQVANGINIAGNAVGGQSNTITQSVGAINDIGSVSVAGVGGAGSGCTGTVILACQKVLSMAADVILTTAGDNSSVLYSPVSTYTLTFGASEAGAQTDLVALVVNSIAGNNQVAVGANVGTLGSTLQLSLGAGQALVGIQSNSTSQYRGTPANLTR
jgi:hypothetical protein